ncbi:MAG: DUF192 domain-containing protein [Nanoarchaeota archaeon]|nr:DUF192 domain-containing protein [Nanoarchaeota archaeon]
MAELIDKDNRVVLENMRVARSGLSLAYGLMFASKKKVQRGMCLVFPRKDVQYGAAITMWFCFMSYEIVCINSNFKVVDKVVLRPFKTSYIPKDKCRYVIESVPGTFKSIEEGDIVRIKF